MHGVPQCQLWERPVRARFLFRPAAPSHGCRPRTGPAEGSTWLMQTQCALRREGGKENCLQGLSASTAEPSDIVTPHRDKEYFSEREGIARN